MIPKIRNKIALVLIIILLLNICTGCWNYMDIEDMAIVAGAALDMDENKNVILTVEIIRTEQSSGSKQANFISTVVSSTGLTIYDAVRNAIKVSKRKLFWSHAKIFICGESFVNNSIYPLIDMIIREIESRQNMEVLVCRGGKAADVIRSSETYHGILAYDIFDNLKAQNSLSKAPRVEAWKIAKQMGEPTKCTALPVIQMITNGNKSVTSVGGAAVFRKGKFAGYLTPDETEYFMFAADLIKGGLLNGEVKIGSQIHKVTLRVYQNSTKIKTIADDKMHPVIELSLDTKTDIVEVENFINITSPEIMNQLISNVESNIEKRVKDVCKKSLKEYGSDIFGFSKYIQIQNTKVWREYEKNNLWDDKVIRNVELKVISNVEITATGMVEKGLKSR